MLKLTAEEQGWLDAYREALNKKHPGTVQEMLIYGSKARGQAHAESDVDVILIVKNDAKALKRELRRVGYVGCKDGRAAFNSRLHGRGVGKPERKRIDLS